MLSRFARRTALAGAVAYGIYTTGKVMTLEHEEALVLFLDSALVREQVVAARTGGHEAGGEDAAGGTTPDGTIPDFSVSWTFVLRPLPETSTRLIERVHIDVPEGRIGALAFQRMSGFGVFLMQRKQLLGIKARAERLWQARVQEPVESHVA